MALADLYNLLIKECRAANKYAVTIYNFYLYIFLLQKYATYTLNYYRLGNLGSLIYRGLESNWGSLIYCRFDKIRPFDFLQKKKKKMQPRVLEVLQKYTISTPWIITQLCNPGSLVYCENVQVNFFRSFIFSYSTIFYDTASKDLVFQSRERV